jgi:murein DD-endopeptidase MepM/ murein hydrolase activator NlpD
MQFIIYLFLLLSPTLWAASISVTPSAVVQGNILHVSIHAPEGLKKPTIHFRNRNYSLFPDADNQWHALLGTDPETKAGAYDIVLDAQTDEGVPLVLKKSILVEKGTFPVSIIEIPKAKKAIAKPEMIATESAVIGGIFRQVSRTQLWHTPFIWPVKGKITTVYGAGRVYDNGKMAWWHRGVDIYRPKGTPVVAPNDGKVLLSRDFKSHGRTIILDHGQTVYSIFNHLNSRSVTVGAEVKRGQRIGTLGDSGIATGPHLHWGLSVGNVRVDPVGWVW